MKFQITFQQNSILNLEYQVFFSTPMLPRFFLQVKVSNPMLDPPPSPGLGMGSILRRYSDGVLEYHMSDKLECNLYHR